MTTAVNAGCAVFLAAAVTTAAVVPTTAAGVPIIGASTTFLTYSPPPQYTMTIYTNSASPNKSTTSTSSTAAVLTGTGFTYVPQTFVNTDPGEYRCPGISMYSVGHDHRGLVSTVMRNWELMRDQVRILQVSPFRRTLPQCLEPRRLLASCRLAPLSLSFSASLWSVWGYTSS